MASFVYNPFSGESSSSQWNKYLQQREFSSDLTSAIKAQTKTYQSEIRKASAVLEASTDNAAKLQAKATADAAAIVVGKLDEGFADIAQELSQLNYTLDWRLGIMIDQQRISNLLLENIALLLRIPDIQKERQYYIEQGFKHYKNAVLDSDLYRDALENLLEAEKREKTDYIVLHRIGMIYLYSKEVSDLPKAEEYFRRAGKYAVVESDPQAARVFNILMGNITENLSSQSNSLNSIKALAADSYFQGGIACYAQGKFAEALEFSSKAFSLIPTILEAGFLKAKSLAASGSESEAAEVVEGLIRTERFYALKTATDGDLAPKTSVQNMLVKLRDEAIRQAKEKIEKCRAKMILQSKATTVLEKIEAAVQENTYLDALTALDELNKERSWIAPFLWGISTPRVINTISSNEINKYTTSIVFSRDSNLVVVTNLLHKRNEPYEKLPSQIWDVSTGALIYTLDGQNQGRFSYSDHDLNTIIKIGQIHNFSSDEKLLYTHNELWSAETGTLIRKLAQGRFASFSPDSKLLAIEIEEEKISEEIIRRKRIQISDVLTGTVIHEIRNQGKNGFREFSPDGKLFATDGGYLDDTFNIYIWDTLTGKQIYCLKEFEFCGFSPDGKIFATNAGLNIGVHIWDVSTGTLIYELNNNQEPTWFGSFSSDGKYISTWSEGVINLWNAETGTKISSLNVAIAKYPWEVNPSMLKFSPDNSFITTFSESKTLKLWNVFTGNLIWEWKPFEKSFHMDGSIFYSRNLTTFACVETGAVKLWQTRESLETFITLERENAKIRLEETKRQNEVENRKRNDLIDQFIKQAKNAEEKQNKKWFGKKDFSEAIALYEKAANLGSQAARDCINKLKQKN